MRNHRQTFYIFALVIVLFFLTWILTLHNKRYPNKALTPGAIDPTATVQKICRPGYAAKVRDVPVAVRQAVFRKYGVTYPSKAGLIEVDHLIPLELGGSNDILNLWIEFADPHPGFHEKDRVENYLHREVCAGRMSLHAAQEAIRTDWYAVYEKMPKRAFMPQEFLRLFLTEVAVTNKQRDLQFRSRRHPTLYRRS